MDEYFDLGDHSRAVTTASAEAQVWFDRGLNWAYAFNREEALRCFEKVVEHDRNCAMGYWGMAYASGPYYNGPWRKIPVQIRDQVVEAASGHIREAQRLSDGCTDVELALISALVERFPLPECHDEEVFDRWDDAYAVAMGAVHARFSDDDDVCALTVDALICRTPWHLWNLAERTPADGADTTEALSILELGIERRRAAGLDPHPGLHHFYIHVMEMSPEPEKALAVSDELRSLVPDAAHLIHMPSHIYILCGQYLRALETNIDAVVADDKYVAEHPEVGIYSIYRLHNLHFQVYAALFLGQYERAVAAADAIWDTVTPETLRHENEFLVNYLEAFYGMKVHVLIRFGRWQDIIEAPLPDDPELFTVTVALWHYAKSVAYSASGDVANGEAQRDQFAAAMAKVPKERMVFNNESSEMLKVGEAMLNGELEYRRGNHEEAFDLLRQCVALYDQLNYTEPWAWMQPPRHALGALLLEQGRPDEAADVYRADLGIDDTLVRPSQHPGNIWGLHGYLECCRLLGRTEEAVEVERQLEAATLLADTNVTSSCFCRRPESCCD